MALSAVLFMWWAGAQALDWARNLRDAPTVA